MKFCLSIVLLAFCAVSAAQSTREQDEFAWVRNQFKLTKSAHNAFPKNGYVPDKDTAIAIAYAVAVPIYGKKLMDEELPFRAELVDGVWVVLGTLHCDLCAGGTVIVEIDKASGKILFMIHTK
jgi:hypothetical protein